MNKLTLNKIIITFQVLFIISILSPSSNAEVFKWTDENGKVHFGDKPPEGATSDKLNIKDVNTIKKASSDENEAIYKKDFFVMPARKSTVPYRFTLTSKLSGKSPGDRLKEFNAKKGKMTFYVHVSMPGVERFQEYKYRSRIIDAKGELVFDKTVSYTPTNGSMFMVNNYKVKPNTDEPGKWTFQGLLDGKKLFVEKRNINFDTPKKEKNESSNVHPVEAGLVSVVPSISDEMIRLPDGSVMKRPKTEKEMDELKRRFQSGTRSATKRGSSFGTGLQSSITQNENQLTKENGKCSNKLSVGCSEYMPIIQDYESELDANKLTNQTDVNTDSPTAATLFNECNTEKLKPGTSRSSLCDLWDDHLKYLQGRMAKECSAAGEKIYKTALNVEGVFLNHPQYDTDNPKRRFTSNILHSARPASPISEYSSPSHARLYRSHEVYSKRDNGYLTKKIKSISKGTRVAKIETDRSVNKEPQSRFEVSYEHITTKDDHDQGFYGDRTWIKDRETGEIMAERIIYFYLINKSVKMQDGTTLKRVTSKNYPKHLYFPCENYVPRLTQFEESHPQNEYEFVSRVLKPAPFTEEENNHLYDLVANGDSRKRRCVGTITVGPSVTPNNLVVSRPTKDKLVGEINGRKIVNYKKDLVLSVVSSSNTFACEYFFNGAPQRFKILFTDGSMMQQKDLLKLGNIDWDED